MQTLLGKGTRLTESTTFKMKSGVLLLGIISSIILLHVLFFHFKLRSNRNSLKRNQYSTGHGNTSRPPVLTSSNSPKTVYKVLLFKPFLYWKKYTTFPKFVTCSNANLSVEFYERDYIIPQDEVIIFSNLLEQSWDELEKNRTSVQIWVMSTTESQSTSRIIIQPLQFRRQPFNFSVTFHSQSDVVVPYGLYSPYTKHRNNIKNILHDIMRNKKHLIAWVSSRCNALTWNRVGFVRDMTKVLPLHLYGKCGNLSLPTGQEGIDILKTYKFILALENSCCGEYITEKFWRVVAKIESVPVVLGARRSDYMRLAPPNSFIHIDDFNSFSELAKFLSSLDKDDEKYLRYFDWKQRGSASLATNFQQIPTNDDSACSFVVRLHHRLISLKENEILLSNLDLYGTSWLGSCLVCGRHSWINRYMTDDIHKVAAKLSTFFEK